MDSFYMPYEDRTPDSQYQDRIRFILENGEMAKDTPQGVGALTCFGTLPQMVFDLANGAPIITDRSIQNFWRKPIAEIIAFAHGVRSIPQLIEYGCDYWEGEKYMNKGTELGLERGDLGPGSYGAAFHDFPHPDGSTFNQFRAVIEQIRVRPELRTHFITPWIPYYQFRGKERKAVVSPCHGWQQFRLLNGRLHLTMFQRSADFPIGVPSNMAQYAAILIMVARATGFQPGRFVHQFGDAHIYEDQVENMKRLLDREPRRLPTLSLKETITNFASVLAEDFELSDYDPHPAMTKIPYHP